MTLLVRAESYQQLLIDKAPLLDVRAPIEFGKGAIPGAVNLPLLDDAEREAVGKIFQQQGQDAAIALGSKLVSAEVREQRVQRWIEFMRHNPNALVYCYRGGLRSKITQQWLAEVGFEIPRIAGGFKALRRFLMDTIEAASSQCQLLVVAGKTGSGKTRLLQQIINKIDLEGIANHRGSAFGTRITPQPTQINFENALAMSLLRLPFEQYHRLIVEDESRAIGSLAIPSHFHGAMSNASIAVIEQPMEDRVDTILNAYIASNYSDFAALESVYGAARFADFLSSSLLRIRKRLGEHTFHEIKQDMQIALLAQSNDGSIEHHRIWIRKLLANYYDPMYEYQLGKKTRRIVFRGNAVEFLHWVSQLKHYK